MANVPVKRTSTSSLAPLMPDWSFDPYQPMRDLLRWDPFAEVARTTQRQALTFMPAFDVKETKEAFIFKADLPGMTDKDIDVSIAGNRLTVSGKREAETQDKGDNYFTYERTYGSFSRAFTLPEAVDVDSIHADLKDGVLKINVPRSPETQPKKIAIKAGSEKGRI